MKVLNFLGKFWFVFATLLMVILLNTGVIAAQEGYSLGENSIFYTIICSIELIHIKMCDYKEEILKAIKENK